MTDLGVERRLAAILAADVVGYSRLMEADEAGTHTRLKALRGELINPAVARHKGRIVKLTGDGVLTEFPSAVGAVLAAAEIQRAVGRNDAGRPAEERIAFRIGINVGDVIIEDDDIYGDGVNIAARLEGLAEPGGICIGRNVYNQVKAKVDFGFAPMGEHRVRNISEPVSVYRVLLDGARWRPVRRSAAARAPIIVAATLTVLIVAAGVGAWLQPWRAAPQEAAAVQDAPWDLPSKPSIAVLPFADLNNDPEQELFVDGLTNDIITDLSKFSSLFVIAANSTFRYKGRAVDVQEVGSDLGVRYVLEGSLQRADDTLRINAQLIDAITGAHVWAERYDRKAGDFFAVQNEITRKVVGVIHPIGEGRGKLQNTELKRIGRVPTDSLVAYDYFLKGVVYKDRFTMGDNIRARDMFEKAAQLDPRFARAIAKNVWTYLQTVFSGWTDDPEQSLRKPMEVARQALAADPTEPWAHYALASVFLMQRKHDLAIQEFQKAYELNPNDASMLNEYGWGLIWAGRAEEGIPLIKQAMRLNPYHPEWYDSSLADGYFVAEDYEAMVATLEQISQPWSDVFRRLAVGYAYLDRMEEARTALARFRELKPDASIEVQAKALPFKHKENLERFLDGLRKAGLPERSPATGT